MTRVKFSILFAGEVEIDPAWYEAQPDNPEEICNETRKWAEAHPVEFLESLTDEEYSAVKTVVTVTLADPEVSG